MKPIVEFLLACMLLLVGGCSAVAGILSTNLLPSIFAVVSIVAFIVLLTYGSKSRQ